MFYPFTHYVRRRRRGSLRVLWREHVSIMTSLPACMVDGQDTELCLGKWMFFVPQTGEKFFHAKDGRIDTLSHSKPDLTETPLKGSGRYSPEEWRAALTTPIDERLAELWVVTERLWAAGLGPEALGLTFAENYSRDGVAYGPTAGLICENIKQLPLKLRCNEADLLDAGVRLDKLRSAVRQQERGYVVDLCSVVGVTPIDADEEIAQALAWIRDVRERHAAAKIPAEALVAAQ